MSCAEASGAVPGLGFLHLSPSSKHPAAKPIGSARGVPRGEPSGSPQDCCAICSTREGCKAWVFRSAESRCFLGNCTEGGVACLERLGARRGATAGVSAGAQVILCEHPDGTGKPKARRAAEKSSRLRGLAERAAGRFALLLLGHRDRLMFETLPSAVIAPTVGAGFAVDVFGYLENSTMARAFRGRRPMGNPAFARLSDAELHATISRQVALAGGEVVDLLIAPRPAARVPADMPQRLSRYSASVKKTVATRMLKERIGLHLIQKREAALGTRYTWVLWTREDSHWFAPLRIHHFDVNEVHGKSCGGFGGWNDKVWLMGRKYADTMLSMYSDWLEPRPAPCSLFSEAGRASAPPADFLQAPSIEQFRERVGLLHRVPYRKHPPEKLPTMDSFYQQIPGAESRLCFPVIYSKGCVPKANQTLVDSLDCGGK